MKGDYIFQQDNASCHSADYTKNHIAQNNITLLDWAAQSVDFVPFEHLWDADKMPIELSQATNNLFKSSGNSFHTLKKVCLDANHVVLIDHAYYFLIQLLLSLKLDTDSVSSDFAKHMSIIRI